MIRLSTFDFHVPRSMEEALDLVAQGNGETKILAGGTDLIIGMKQPVSQPKGVVWLGKVGELQRIAFSRESGLNIGSMCTLDEIVRNEDVKECFPSMVRAIRSIASPQIRNRATIGGNVCLNTRCFYYDQSDFWRGALGFCLKHGNGVCHAAPGQDRCTAVFCSDLAPLLIALNATVRISGPEGRRNIRLSELYSNDGAHYLTLRRGEILTQVLLPYVPGRRSIHVKFRHRNSFDFPLVNAGIALEVSDNLICTDIRIIVGAVASAPIDAKEISRHVVGKRLTEELIDSVAEKVSILVHPMPNIDDSVSHRKKLVRVLVRRALQEAVFDHH
jgi:4-hydroxybenzoyl-CoA reductase subunit beta